MPQTNAEAVRLYKRRHPDRIRAARIRRTKSGYGAKVAREWRQKHPERVKEQRQRLTQELRKAVLHRLGPYCKRCGYHEDERALQIDHIHGGGTKDRKQRGGVWGSYRRMLNCTDAELRQKYQILCANCNWIKRYERREH